jgi:hypothetical protein
MSSPTYRLGNLQPLLYTLDRMIRRRHVIMLPESHLLELRLHRPEPFGQAHEDVTLYSETSPLSIIWQIDGA